MERCPVVATATFRHLSLVRLPRLVEHVVKSFYEEMSLSGGSLAWIAFTASIPILVNHFYLIDRGRDRILADREMEEGYALPVNETFDFIIVGAGTAGCILARRLSERYSVLLLEAGGEPPPVEAITNVISFTNSLPEINWLFHSSQQLYTSLQTGGLVQMPAGKMLGGSGSHNNVQYERGSTYDYDNWANWTGDSSWKYENVLKYFLRSENYRGQFTTANGQHRTGGLMDVVTSEVPFREDLFFSAGQELGYDVRIDTNGPQRIGFGPAEYNRFRGRRVSTYSAYVKPVMGNRANLKVRKYSVVSKVIIDNLRAVGVHYVRHGVPRIAFASKEVILSAGAFISPMILIRSGIGPRDQLDLLQKEPVVELPVGLNLQTHIVLDVSINVTDKTVFKYSPNTVTFRDFEEFKARGTGFLASRESLHEAFLASNRTAACGQPQWPDIQLFLFQGYRDGTDVLNCTVNVNRLRSVGRLLLNRTATTLEGNLSPVLDYNLFSDETDYDVVIEGIRLCQKIAETRTLKNIGAQFILESMPECERFTQDSRDYWICVIRQRSSPSYHATSTARMGAENDTTAVLDTSLRVRGINGLRVVDASIMPFITNANTNAAVMMIAEKASESILRQWDSCGIRPNECL